MTFAPAVLTTYQEAQARYLAPILSQNPFLAGVKMLNRLQDQLVARGYSPFQDTDGELLEIAWLAGRGTHAVILDVSEQLGKAAVIEDGDLRVIRQFRLSEKVAEIDYVRALLNQMSR